MSSLITAPGTLASYLQLADLKAMALDYDLTPYTDAQLQRLLLQATGKIDAVLSGTLLASEITKTFYGEGSNTLDLHVRPLLYIRKIQFLQPGVAGYVLPPQTLAIDGVRGQVIQYYPIELQGIGNFTRFADGMPFEVTYGYGYGANPNPITPPAWSSIDVAPYGGSLVPGTYDVGVTTKTRWGETLETVRSVLTATGAFSITIAPSLGAYLYRVFIAPSGEPRTLAAEIAPTTYGNALITQAVSNLGPIPNYFPEAAPTVDTSAPPYPQEFSEACRLMFLSILYEQNSLANRGIAGITEGRKDVRWRSTEGNSGKGVPRFYEESLAALSPYMFAEIY